MTAIGSASDAAQSGATKTVIVVGAGPVGVFLAYKLGRSGIQVTILEKDKDTNDGSRACGYFGASTEALRKADLYDKILEQGFLVKGLCWRKKPVDDGKGGKRLGDLIAALPLVEDMNAADVPRGQGLLCLRQSKLTLLMLREALDTGNVSVHFDNEVVGVEEHGNTISAFTKVGGDSGPESLREYSANFLVGADGGRSRVRKLLDIPFAGHTWPERVMATDVMMRNTHDFVYHCYYVLDRTNFAVSTPLEDPVKGEKTLWRFTIALDPAETRPDEEVSTDQEIKKLYDMLMPGTRPLDIDIKQRFVYRIHQRLAASLRRGRSLLVGDAAHVCCPYGAMGLNTGLLDADALSDALSMIMNEGKPLDILNIYSDERSRVFQTFVDPTTTYNKLRIHSHDQETAVTNDWYYRMMQNPSKEDLLRAMRPYFDVWPTDMRKETEVKMRL